MKVGIGPAAICTTRVVAGVGMPQLTAILDCAGPCSEHGVPLIADGGVRYSGDVAKAIAAGASAVMIGNLFAGTDDSPGEVVYRHGERYKEYRGMGSIGAMKDRANSTRDRYGQHEVHDEAKLVAEGVEAQTPYRATHHQHDPATGGRPALGHGLCWRAQHSRDANASTLRARDGVRRRRESRSRRRRGQRSTELPDRRLSRAITAGAGHPMQPLCVPPPRRAPVLGDLKQNLQEVL